jgi:hypothetical protein
VTRETSDQEEALAEHQERLAADREEEDVPKRWSDWRGAETASLEELVGEVEEEVNRAEH